jgi:hypothetical protein
MVNSPSDETSVGMYKLKEAMEVLQWSPSDTPKEVCSCFSRHGNMEIFKLLKGDEITTRGYRAQNLCRVYSSNSCDSGYE